MSSEQITVIFVHNEDGGLKTSIKDVARHAVKKKNEHCNLCSIIFSTNRTRRTWNDFTRCLNINFQYLYRDEFIHQFAINDGFPAAYLYGDENMRVLISREKMEAVVDVQELMELCIDRLDSAGIIETHF
jgi:hypothetical protein